MKHVDIDKATEVMRKNLETIQAGFAALGPRPSWWRFRKRRDWNLASGMLHAALALHQALADKLLEEVFRRVGEKIAASLEKKLHGELTSQGERITETN